MDLIEEEEDDDAGAMYDTLEAEVRFAKDEQSTSSHLYHWLFLQHKASKNDVPHE